MFGHGQIEGYTEKYGMEYRWPRYEETPDQWLVERHEREIAPLLHQRALFAESSNFLLYDFFHADGSVDENVFAYSNRRGDQRALVLYNNRFSTTRGTIDNSAAYADKSSGHLRQRRLKEGLELKVDPALILAYRDSLTGLEYLRRSVNVAERGLTLELHAYQCHVFLDWRELRASAEAPWDALCDHLAGRGVPKLEDALVSLELSPVHNVVGRVLEPGLLRNLAELSEHPPAGPEQQKAFDLRRDEFLETLWKRNREFLREAQSFYREHNGSPVALTLTNPASMKERFNELARAAMRIPALEALFPEPWPGAARRMLPSHSPQLTATAMWGPVIAWCALELLAESVGAEDSKRAALDLFDRLRLREPLAHAFESLGFPGEESWRVAARIKVALLIEANTAAKADVAPTNVVPTNVVPTNVVPTNVVPTKADAVPTTQSLTETKPTETEPEAAPPPAILANPKFPAEPKPEPLIPILPPELWQDPDVRWLTGAHESKGHSYFVKESYEELLWWLKLPSLVTLASEIAPARLAMKEIRDAVSKAAKSAASANYRIDALTGGGDSAPEAANTAASEIEAAAEKPEEASPLSKLAENK
jgi:hypothetical protein